MMTKEGSTKIVNFFTPEAGLLRGQWQFSKNAMSFQTAFTCEFEN